MTSHLVLQFERGDSGPWITSAKFSESRELSEPNAPDIRPSPGFRAFLQLAIETRLAHLENNTRYDGLKGPENSPAEYLYRAYDNANTNRISWPRRIFSTNEQFQKCLDRISSQNGAFFRAGFDASVLLGENIRVVACECDISEDRDRLLKLYIELFGTTPGGRELRLGILRSGELAYTRDIEQGLRDGLEEMGYDLNRTPESEPGLPCSPTSDDGRAAWSNAIKKGILNRQKSEPFDFVIAIGTQAMLALQLHYGRSLGLASENPKALFLGVTYPIAAHVIDSLYSRFEQREVCGVAYGADGLRSIAGVIHNWLQPEAKLRFVYFPQYTQDLDAADQLRRTRLHAEGHLTIHESSPETFEKAMDDPDAVYFSWYTFEAIFESYDPKLVGLVSFLEQRKIVATTRRNCEEGYAFAAVSADDREIGRMGARLISSRMDGTVEHLGRQDVLIPRIRYWLNGRVMRAQEIRVDAEVTKSAERIYEELD